RQVRDELARRGLERGEIELERVAKVQVDVRAAGEGFSQGSLERPVELDSVDVTGVVRQVRGEDTEARADLEHDVVWTELREAADHPEQVLVDEKVLAELLPCGSRAHGKENAAAALASRRATSSAGSSPRASASTAAV